MCVNIVRATKRVGVEPRGSCEDGRNPEFQRSAGATYAVSGGQVHVCPPLQHSNDNTGLNMSTVTIRAAPGSCEAGCGIDQQEAVAAAAVEPVPGGLRRRRGRGGPAKLSPRRPWFGHVAPDPPRRSCVAGLLPRTYLPAVWLPTRRPARCAGRCCARTSLVNGSGEEPGARHPDPWRRCPVRRSVRPHGPRVAFGQVRPADEHVELDSLPRQLDFYGGELRASDIELGRVALACDDARTRIGLFVWRWRAAVISEGAQVPLELRCGVGARGRR